MADYQDMAMGGPGVAMGALDEIEGDMDGRLLEQMEAPISGIPTPDSVIPKDDSAHPKPRVDEAGVGLGGVPEVEADVDPNELEQAIGQM